MKTFSERMVLGTLFTAVGMLATACDNPYELAPLTSGEIRKALKKSMT